MDNFALVLFSGGLDSTACIHYYIDQKFIVNAIYIDYGQDACFREKTSAINIASYFGINLKILSFVQGTRFSQGEIQGRNAFLVSSALLAYPKKNGLLCLGIHSGTPYYDCSELFVKDMNRILEGYTDGRIILATPFLKWDKKMIYNYCKNNNLPIHLTYSCEVGKDTPCGKCPSCLDREALDAC